MAKNYTDNQNSNGTFVCPKCGSQMVAMSTGNGFRCGVAGNRWMNGRWSKCDGVIWVKNKNPWGTGNVIPRPADFPTIKTPTDEQTQIFDHLATAPDMREIPGRCTIIDAAHGTGKTTTLSSGCRFIQRRLGSMSNYPFLAFGRNARDVLLSKMPTSVEIYTMNGFGGRAQGYNVRSYKPGKSANIFRDLVSNFPRDERPNAGCMYAIIERMRDLCIFSADAGDKNFWRDAIADVLIRFQGMNKKYTKNAETINEYLPLVATKSFADGSVIDINEQITRPVIEACARTGWRMPSHLCRLNAEWSDADVTDFARFIRSIRIGTVRGLVIDEAQDLSYSQIALFLAMSYKSGELTIIGDDNRGEPGDDDYKAGQAIFGWRGAFAGSMNLIARVWHELTGETASRLDLSVTHRCPPEHVDAGRALNRTVTSSKPRGTGKAFSVNAGQAFEAWCNLPEGKTALWITRTNAPLSAVFIETLKRHKAVTIRGGGEIEGQIRRTFYDAGCGYPDFNSGEYACGFAAGLEFVRAAQMEEEEQQSAFSGFIVGLMEAIQNDPHILTKANLPAVPTLAHVEKFICFFADEESPRVLATVYRTKGDEADLVVVDDTAKFNETWNEDADEAAACRLVASTRSKEIVMIVGKLAGFDAPPADDDEAFDMEPARKTPTVAAAATSPAVKPVAARRTFKR